MCLIMDSHIIADIEATGVSKDPIFEPIIVDELGLDVVDRTVLEAIIDKFGGGPVGLDTLAAATGEEASTIEDVVEPFLIQLGFIGRTPRGRVCTANAYKHLGRAVPQPKGVIQTSLFDDEDNA